MKIDETLLKWDKMNDKNIKEWTNQEIKELSILLSHSSCAMEGNTLSLGETRDLLTNGNVNYLTLKKLRDTFEIKNLDKSIRYVFDNYKLLNINIDTIKELHKIVMNNIITNNGELRNHNVRINNSNVLPYDWTVLEYKLKKLNEWYCDEVKEVKTTDDKEPLIYEYHARFEKIHPFSDGNGRTGRVLILLMQLQNDLAVKYVNILDRDDYISALDQYQLSGNLTKLKSVFKELIVNSKGEK